jgi:predicted peptidase
MGSIAGLANVKRFKDHVHANVKNQKLKRLIIAMTYRQILFAVLLCLASAPAFARKHETGFLDRTVSVNGEIYRYQVFVPQDFDSHKKWPVILFLHGVGERGDDGVLQTEYGIGHAIRQSVPRFPFIVVMPQCRKDKNERWINAPMQAQALAALEQSIKEFHGDRERLYLTGLSMGGYGVWDLAAKYPGKFAAYAPICGGIHGPIKLPEIHVGLVGDPNVADPYAETARRIGSTPIWIFHGDADDTVSVEESRKMTQALQAAKANVRYTEYPGVGHNAWDKAYAEPELIPWLLAQKLHN